LRDSDQDSFEPIYLVRNMPSYAIGSCHHFVGDERNSRWHALSQTACPLRSKHSFSSSILLFFSLS